jgi:hypothetical protein
MIYYEIYSLSVGGFERGAAIAATNDAITRNGGKIDEECLLMLADTETAEPPVEEITDAVAALRKLENWSALGAITYYLPGGLTTASFSPSSENTAKVSCITLSIPENTVEIMLGNGTNVLMEIAGTLHKQLKADRTIAERGLEYSGFSWRRELEKLKRQEVVGEYLIDLITQ